MLKLLSAVIIAVGLALPPSLAQIKSPLSEIGSSAAQLPPELSNLPTCVGGPDRGKLKKPLGPPTAANVARCRAVPTGRLDPPGTVRVPPQRRPLASQFRANQYSIVPASFTPRAAAAQQAPWATWQTGAQTTGTSYTAIWGGLTVQDITIWGGPHANTDHDFVYANFIAQGSSSSGGGWVAVGWGEVLTNGDHRYVTSYTQNYGRQFFTQYALTDGQLYSFAITSYSTGSGPLWATWIWYNDQWNVLQNDYLPFASASISEEVDAKHTCPYDCLPGFPAIYFVNTYLENSSGVHLWDTNIPTSKFAFPGPYCATFIDNYYYGHVSWCY